MTEKDKGPVSQPAGKQQLSPEQIQQLISMMQNRKPLNKRQEILAKIINKTLQFMQYAIYNMDRFIKFIIKKEDIETNDVVKTARGPILFGTYVIGIFIVFGGLWSALAPLDSAAVAIGTVIPSSKRKVIQHPQGGIIKEILVHQGDEVKAGDKIIEFDEIQLRANYESNLNQYRVAEANEDRLTAERDGLENIVFDELLTKEADNPVVQKLMNTQKELFKSRKAAYTSKLEALNQRHEQLAKQLEGAHAKLVASKKTFEVHKERQKSTKELFEKGFAQKALLLEAEARTAAALSEVSQIESEIARIKQATLQDEAEMLSTKSAYMTEILQQLQETQRVRNEARERFVMAKDSLDRAILHSPVDGIIIDVNPVVYTKGGVVGGGAMIAEIVPSNDTLIVEAKVPAKNIDSVKVGLQAKMKFSAFKSRTSPMFHGTVIALSPDIIQDRQAAAAMSPMMAGDGNFYVAKIEIDMEEFNKIAKERGLKLRPGMQAEVQIITGTRTLLRYLLDPVADNMFRAFKER